MTISFWVAGVPRPQGSKDPVRGRGGAIVGMRESSPGLVPWRAAVKLAARRAAGGELARIEPIAAGSPVAVKAHFFVVGDPTEPPDLDKLCRAVGDALTDAGVITDDSQITAWDACKMAGLNPGAWIVVR